MKKFKESFKDIDRLTQSEQKPLCAMLGKLMEEVGETAECVLIHEGFITHKQMKEPLVGEIADTIQVALSILVRSTPELTTDERYDLLLSHLERKNNKWEAVQGGESKRVHITKQATRAIEKREEEIAKPTAPSHDIELRVKRVFAEQLGVYHGDVKPNMNIIDDFGADSLDLIELCMGIEDEFEMEISDDDAERIHTVQEVITYVYNRYELKQKVDDMLSTSEVSMEDLISEPDPLPPTKEYFDPAADYTERTGRYLSRDERMNERLLHDFNKTRY